MKRAHIERQLGCKYVFDMGVDEAGKCTSFAFYNIYENFTTDLDRNAHTHTHTRRRVVRLIHNVYGPRIYAVPYTYTIICIYKVYELVRYSLWCALVLRIRRYTCSI